MKGIAELLDQALEFNTREQHQSQEEKRALEYFGLKAEELPDGVFVNDFGIHHFVEKMAWVNGAFVKYGELEVIAKR